MNSIQNLTKIERKWSELWDCCQKCRTTQKRHSAHGLCHKCYMQERKKRDKSEKNLIDELTIKQEELRRKNRRWSKHHDFCIKCGRNDRPHASKGLCNVCYKILNDKRWREKRKNQILEGRNGRKLKPCAICKKLVFLKPGQAFCNDCRNSDKVRFGSWMPNFPPQIRRKVG